MAVLYIAEFTELASDARGGGMQAPPMPPRAQQTVAIGGASVQSSAFAKGTKFIRVHTDAICSIAVGSNPTATATQLRLAAGQTEYFGVHPDDKIAVITNT
jgi:hypothetical protein